MAMFEGMKKVSYFSFGIIIMAAVGFIYKISEFIRSLGDADAASFAIIPLGSYFLAGSGFFCFLVWSISRGEFQDIEDAKHRMLDNEIRYAAEAGEDVSEWTHDC